ncbi:type II toxin-antitoxin system VapC family toxin [Tardiphaga alba]|uniref:Type II toxin-antitoxin system VapC family toxin n=1 Tax=Tardiphaga alba TaxID=340268 RepID=A0ABX8A9B6_9BRAD|nr:type II toxin-antitoxin system VapC family toxin [Tardiphaga alba]QUS40349.1 type II toxin-antitoxin system VapC family toxin [Tardiphaga alba]
MVSSLLLDTCALIFLTIDDGRAAKVRAALKNAHDAGETVFVSPISAWEIGLLASLGRVNLLTSPERWFDTVIETPGVRLAGLSPAVLIASSFLPDAKWRDPADRIMAATAREYGFTLLTSDKQLLAYAAKGHIRALLC